MNNYTDNSRAVAAVLSNYFNGIFNGDSDLLRTIFHPQALIFGDVEGRAYFKNLEQYLEGVKIRTSPSELNETFRMEILSIEIINSIAIAKVRVPIFGYNYYDLLSLNQIKGRWTIVNKLLTHVNV